MTQLYLCEEPYWSKYDRSEICPHALQINVISDGKDEGGRGDKSTEEQGALLKVLTVLHGIGPNESYITLLLRKERLAGYF